MSPTWPCHLNRLGGYSPYENNNNNNAKKKQNKIKERKKTLL